MEWILMGWTHPLHPSPSQGCADGDGIPVAWLLGARVVVGAGLAQFLAGFPHGLSLWLQDILLFCWAYEQEERPTFTKLMDMLEKLPKRNRRLSHPGHFWKSAE